MEKKEIYWILGILMIISFFGILFNIFPDTSLNYRTYEFRISAHPQNDFSYYVRNYSLNYDFEKENGEISFKFFDKQKIGNSIQITLPPQLSITNYSISPFELSDCNNSGNYLTCWYNGNLESQLSFMIKIKKNDFSKEKFQPNGLFIFGDIRDFSLSDNEGYEKDSIILNFNLGKKYRCGENCFIREMSSEKLDYYLDGSHLIVYLHQGEEKIFLPHFRLNTYDYQKKILSATFLTFFISLLSGVILLILQNIQNKNKIFIYLRKINFSYPIWPWNLWIKR